MRFEKNFKSYSNDQWLLCREQTWFKMVDILHALMLNKKIIDEMIFNYTEKPISERLSQIINDFSNI
jgi:hypothetical protein